MIMFRITTIVCVFIALITSKADSESALKAPRWLVAAPHANGKISLSWRLDDASVKYNVYRGTTSGTGYMKINTKAVTTTSFLDSRSNNDKTYYYAVRATKDGIESANSNEAEAIATSNSTRFNIALVFDYKGNTRDIMDSPYGGGFGSLWVGDLNGDGNPDYFMAGWGKDGKTRVFKAFDHRGRLMWENTHFNPNGKCHYWSGPSAVWDFDGDGKCEVITDYYADDRWYMVIREGNTGDIKTKIALAGRPYRQFQVANFRGLSRPQDIFVTVNPGGEADGEVHDGATIYVFKYQDGSITEMWHYTSAPSNASQNEFCHVPKAEDVDYDGYDELMAGKVFLDHNGNILWKKYFTYYHIDTIVIDEIDGDKSNGREIFLGGCGNGDYIMLDKNGNKKWSGNFPHHCHRTYAENVRSDHPGKEIIVNGKNGECTRLLDSDTGEIIWEAFDISNDESYIINWTCEDGEELMEIFGSEVIIDGQKRIVYDGSGMGMDKYPQKNCFRPGFCALDVIGDYREEFFVAKDGKFYVITNTNPTSNARPSPWENPDEYIIRRVNTWWW